MQTTVEQLRAAFERAAADDGRITIRDADLERRGDAFEGGFVILVEGMDARAELNVSEYTAILAYDEHSDGQSLHPVPELRLEDTPDDVTADRIVGRVLSNIRDHVNRRR